MPEDSKVLQVGYGLGDILASLFPKNALSVDDDPNIIISSTKRYPHIRFQNLDIAKTNIKEKFDYVIFPNSIEHMFDVQTVLEKVKSSLHKDSRIIITSVNPRWQQLFSILEKFKLKRPEAPKNWLRLEDLVNIVEISGYEIVNTGFKVLLPTHIPLISNWVNKFNSRFCVEQYLVAKSKIKSKAKPLTCSVIIPCFNEEENIKKCINSVPKMGKRTEIIVVDDGSTDKTSSVVKNLMKKNKNLRLISYKPNKGKGYAVKQGFDGAKGDVVMILDADMAVPVSELPRFFNLLESKEAGFVNGTRLIYPMEDQAMRQLNLIGNLVFGWIFSWVLNQRITDTLCGTKALLKKDYLKIKMGGESWGDFDLLFGAAENKLKIVDMPVHYMRRVAGKSKMKAFQHGLVLAKMCFVGWWRLKASPLFRNTKRDVRKRVK
ncbi:MAG TPA: glycosyltransferase [Patescibacteria group bacterium]|nr:glycosyltransferase [Patescibacteria group bacterium]